MGTCSEPPQGRIPKRLIQTAKTANVPLVTQAMMANVRLLNPDFEFLFLDDAQVEEFITTEFPQYRTVFDSFQFAIQKYDFFRYLAVYHYGGFYFDTDVLLASNLTPLLKHSCVFPFEALTVSRHLRVDLGMDWIMGNYAFGSAPGHPFLKAVIDNCVRGQLEPKWVRPMMQGSPPFLDDEFFVLNSSGPGLVSRTFAENPDLAKTVTLLLPNDKSDLDNWNRFGGFGVHLCAASWRPKQHFIRRRIAGHCWNWIQKRNIERHRHCNREANRVSEFVIGR
jgi:inositol phosphorylceramide mannosyltransferase catalytic subunit